MNRLLTLSAILSAALCLAMAGSAPAAEKAHCAAEAASPFQPGYEEIGKSRSDVDASAAIDACEAAAEADPEDMDVRAWLARAYYIAGRYDDMPVHLDVAAQAGHAVAQQILGTALVAGHGMEADPQRGFALLGAAAAQGYASAEYSLGLAYLWGEGTDPDPEAAAPYFELAAGKGLVLAKVELAALLLEGNGVEADPARAIRLFEEAAEAGNALAMFNLGFIHQTGHGVEPDQEAAFRWFGDAEAAGHALAAAHLAAFHVEGAVVGEVPQEAMRLAQKAADAGEGYGHYILGYMAELGVGQDADIEKAIAHYEAAAALGDEAAAAALAELSPAP